MRPAPRPVCRGRRPRGAGPRRGCCRSCCWICLTLFVNIVSMEGLGVGDRCPGSGLWSRICGARASAGCGRQLRGSYRDAAYVGTHSVCLVLYQQLACECLRPHRVSQSLSLADTPSSYSSSGWNVRAGAPVYTVQWGSQPVRRPVLNIPLTLRRVQRELGLYGIQPLTQFADIKGHSISRSRAGTCTILGPCQPYIQVQM